MRSIIISVLLLLSPSLAVAECVVAPIYFRTKGLLLGDSTVASYAGQNAVASYFLTAGDTRNGGTLTDRSVAGETIAQQSARWTADANKATYDWVVIQVGLNDLNPAESAATALGRYQTMVNTINSDKKTGAQIIAVTMTPCKERLTDLYGAGGPTSYAKWQDMNTAISGGGASPIAGVTYHVTTHTTTLNDGSGNLAATYDTGDHIHENNAARAIIACEYRMVLAAAGYLGNVFLAPGGTMTFAPGGGTIALQ